MIIAAVIINDKEYQLEKVKGKVLKKVFKVNKEKITNFEEQFDSTLEIIALAFDNKFTTDDILDNLSADEIKDLGELILKNMLGSTTEKMDELSKN